MSDFIGVPSIGGADKVAAAAIRHACITDGTYYVLLDEVGRVNVRKVTNTLKRVPAGWIATIDYDADPAWLADEIAEACQ
jgi:hypothetical protein